MAKILILGGGGMIGQKLISKLLNEGLAPYRELDIVAFDLGFAPDALAGVQNIRGSLTDEAALRQLCAQRPDVVFHLASIVSGEAAENFDKGWDINMFPTWTLLQALRAEHLASKGVYVPRVIFTSSIAVFGGPFEGEISDNFLSAPQTSYGSQKAICELMLSDFSRKGFVDGLSLRLPTICVRPGKPNLAASSFFSGIIREPINGETAYLPVDDQVQHWFASPKAAAAFLTHAATLESAALMRRRALNLPGVSCTVAEQIESLRRVVGQKAVDLIISRPDPLVERIVSGWPRAFDPKRAIALGFCADVDFDAIIQTYLDEDFRP